MATLFFRFFAVIITFCLLLSVEAKVRLCCPGDTCEHYDATCPSGETTTVVNPENCQLYFTCIDGLVSPEKCPLGTMFDVNFLGCATAVAMNCAGRPVPDETGCIYICEEDLGLFPNEEDTTNQSYYYCYQKIPTLMHCPSGTTYHDDANGICSKNPTIN